MLEIYSCPYPYYISDMLIRVKSYQNNDLFSSSQGNKYHCWEIVIEVIPKNFQRQHIYFCYPLEVVYPDCNEPSTTPRQAVYQIIHVALRNKSWNPEKNKRQKAKIIPDIIKYQWKFVRVSLEGIDNMKKYKAIWITCQLFVRKSLSKWCFKRMCFCRYTVEVLLYSSFTCHPQAKEKQEELAMDMKILEKLLDDTRNEVKEQTQRKVCSCFKWFQYLYSSHLTCTCTKCMRLQRKTPGSSRNRL